MKNMKDHKKLNMYINFFLKYTVIDKDNIISHNIKILNQYQKDLKKSLKLFNGCTNQRHINIMSTLQSDIKDNSNQITYLINIKNIMNNNNIVHVLPINYSLKNSNLLINKINKPVYSISINLFSVKFSIYINKISNRFAVEFEEVFDAYKVYKELSLVKKEFINEDFLKQYMKDYLLSKKIEQLNYINK